MKRLLFIIYFILALAALAAIDVLIIKDASTSSAREEFLMQRSHGTHKCATPECQRQVSLKQTYCGDCSQERMKARQNGRPSRWHTGWRYVALGYYRTHEGTLELRAIDPGNKRTQWVLYRDGAAVGTFPNKRSAQQSLLELQKA